MKTITYKMMNVEVAVFTVLFKYATLSNAFYSLACELTAQAVNAAHDTALVESFERALTALEKNMFKRMTTESATSSRSMFKQSLANTQSYAIDNAMSEFHSVHELKKLLSLSEARIISHKRHLVKEFHHVCKLVVSEDSKKFKFELLKRA